MKAGVFMFANIKIKPLLISIGLALLAGIVSCLLGNSSSGYEELIRPSFAPDGIVFPIVWIILYILMGISAYFIYCQQSCKSKNALIFYFVQLIVNSLWTFFFFGLQMYLFGFWWIILLIVLVSITMFLFYKIKPFSAYLLIPYLIWLIFAAVLNYNIYLLN